MGKIGKTTTKRHTSPARTPEKRENQLINLAMDLAEQKLRDGTASSQLISHFLKLATTKEELENERLRADLKLSEAKVKQIEESSNRSDIYNKAIEAFRSYAVAFVDEDEDDE